EFLDWVSRETGRKLIIADDDTRRQLAAIRMHGDIHGLQPLQALKAVVASTSLQLDLPPGAIRVSFAGASPASTRQPLPADLPRAFPGARGRTRARGGRCRAPHRRIAAAEAEIVRYRRHLQFRSRAARHAGAAVEPDPAAAGGARGSRRAWPDAGGAGT